MDDRDTAARRYDLWGLALGALAGAIDASALLLFDADLTLAGRDVTVPLIGLFLGTFAALGFAVGRLAMARERARRDADLIARQLRELEDSQRALLQHEKLAAVGRLAAGIAHEVRNPLGVIRSAASVVQEGFGKHDDSWRACEFIREETARLDGLVTALLDFAKPRPLRVQRVGLATVAERALPVADEVAARAGVTLERQTVGVLPALEADADLLAQALIDLVSNAVEASAVGGRVVLRLIGDAQEALVEVADSGPGVAAENVERVFEPFFTTKAQGTGLGLAMACRIAEAHGGSVSLVEGRGAGGDGAGACFRLRLPIRAAHAAAV
jgi:two-component system sensor histidine kinase HydH